MTSTRIVRKTVCTTLLAATLVSCGGDSGAFDDGENMAGYFNGSYTLLGQASRETRLLVDSNGEFLLYAFPYIYIGELRTSGETFTGEADTYSLEGDITNGTPSLIEGVVQQADAAEGTFAGGGLTGTFLVEYSALLSTLPIAPEVFDGSYVSYATVGATGSTTGTMTLQDGNFTVTYGNGCQMNGKISVRERDGNLYNYSANLTNCPTNGSARGMGYRNDEQELRLYGRVGGQPMLLSLELPPG